LLATGCAAQSGARASDGQLSCPPGQAPICTLKMGRQEECACKFEEDFEEIFGPHRR
jgi:hypothetical protein